MATIVNALKNHIAPDVLKIFSAVFGSTLDMINKDFENFPEHRINFYMLLNAITTHCFPALISLSSAQFKLVVDAVVWGIKHPMRDVADTSLKVGWCMRPRGHAYSFFICTHVKI